MLFRFPSALLLLFGLLAPSPDLDKPHTIPLQGVAGGPQLIQATIDGHKGLFLFDSGFGVSSVTPQFAREIGCKPWGNLVGFRAIGEKVQGPHCNEATLTLDGVQRRLPTVGFLDLMHYMPPNTPVLSGAIGLDAFAGSTITIRSGAQQIVLETKASLAQRIRLAHEIPIRLVRDSQGASLSVDAGVPTSSGMSWMELDTGNTGPNMVSQAIAPLFGLKADREGVQMAGLEIVPGIAATGQVQVMDLILDGNLGRSFLDHWDLTLDLARERAWLSPADALPKR